MKIDLGRRTHHISVFVWCLFSCFKGYYGSVTFQSITDPIQGKNNELLAFVIGFTSSAVVKRSGVQLSICTSGGCTNDAANFPRYTFDANATVVSLMFSSLLCGEDAVSWTVENAADSSSDTYTFHPNNCSILPSNSDAVTSPNSASLVITNAANNYQIFSYSTGCIHPQPTIALEYINLQNVTKLQISNSASVTPVEDTAANCTSPTKSYTFHYTTQYEESLNEQTVKMKGTLEMVGLLSSTGLWQIFAPEIKFQGVPSSSVPPDSTTGIPPPCNECPVNCLPWRICILFLIVIIIVIIVLIVCLVWWCCRNENKYENDDIEVITNSKASKSQHENYAFDNINVGYGKTEISHNAPEHTEHENAGSGKEHDVKPEENVNETPQTDQRFNQNEFESKKEIANPTQNGNKTTGRSSSLGQGDQNINDRSDNQTKLKGNGSSLNVMEEGQLNKSEMSGQFTTTISVGDNKK